MEPLSGQPVTGSPFQMEEEVGTLLFAEYPSTVVLADTEDRPVIREWVDCSDNGETDRYFYFRTNANNLNLFINGAISHRSLVQAAEGGLYYFEDVRSRRQEVVTRRVFTKDFPVSCYPGETIITRNEVVSLERISSRFGLQEDASSTSMTKQVKQLAVEKQFETFNLYLRAGHGVGHGTIKADVLGQLLLHFDSMYEESVLNRLTGKTEAPKIFRTQASPYLHTQVYYTLPGSYSILLKPQELLMYYDIDEEVSSAEDAADTLFGLINFSLTPELLRSRFREYSPRLIDSYKTFVQTIRDNRVDLDFCWFNPKTGIMHNEALTIEKTSLIAGNIESLTSEEEVPLTLTGKFDLLNCSTGHFTFSTPNELISGYFSERTKESIRQVNFVDTYTVSIIRKTTTFAGKPEPRVEHTLTAFFRGAAG